MNSRRKFDLGKGPAALFDHVYFLRFRLLIGFSTEESGVPKSQYVPPAGGDDPADVSGRSGFFACCLLPGGTQELLDRAKPAPASTSPNVTIYKKNLTGSDRPFPRQEE